MFLRGPYILCPEGNSSRPSFFSGSPSFSDWFRLWLIFSFFLLFFFLSLYLWITQTTWLQFILIMFLPAYVRTILKEARCFSGQIQLLPSQGTHTAKNRFWQGIFWPLQVCHRTYTHKSPLSMYKINSTLILLASFVKLRFLQLKCLSPSVLL